LGTLKPTLIRRQLTSKFKFVDTGGKRHDRHKLVVGESVIAVVDVSRGSREFRTPQLSLMAKQLNVSVGQFEKMITCTISAEEYLALIGGSSEMSRV